ncbi:protein EFR3 homolog B-like [Clavelina lepadiformis]|uniref:protein EFR3 homolog B-like n=1 Tax=Clavelina lepadiformis TaxID=159417 RepID=UPI004042D044
MAGCVCCSALKPRYKRLVDNIFPSSPEKGLVRSEMEKLTYYAVSAPEKLDRIGVYLARKLTRDIARHRDKAVFIAMEALNQLLLACHAQQINLFVESFLRMVATLLESANAEFQALGTHSFEKFSKIEEDTASYHRRYDFFVSKFSSMCHSNQQDNNIRLKAQLNGVQGLRGVIRKTVSDELQVNIWEKQHMDKIISSLLYIMQNDTNDEKHNDDGSPVPKEDSEHPSSLAEESFRELLSRAAFANVPAAVSPALSHMDNHKLWTPDSTFAIKCFKIIMYSVQGQYSHLIVKMLLDHLDNHGTEKQHTRASILQVLCAIVPIPSSAAIGPSVIDVFNRLARHLKISTERLNQKDFVNALIETTGVLAGVVPDYQKLEIITFYITKSQEAICGSEDGEGMISVDKKFASLLLQSLHRISKTYHASNLSTLSSTLLDPLLKVALLTDPSERLLAHNLLISLFDRNQNESRLTLVSSQTDVESMGLVSSAASKYDVDFLDRRLPSIYHWLFESFKHDDNSINNFMSLYKCALVLCLSIFSPDIITDMTCLTLAVQGAAIELLNNANQPEDVIGHVSQVLASTASIMLVLAHLSAIPEFQHYVNQVMLSRNSIAPQLMPEHALTGQKTRISFKFEPEALSKVIFTSTAIYDALVGRIGFNIEKLNQPFLANLPLDTLSSEGKHGPIDVESINISFTMGRETSVTLEDGVMPANTITYQYLKQVFTKPPISRKEQMAKNQKVADHIRSVPFEQLIAEMKPDPTIECKKWYEQVINTEANSVEDEGIDPLVFPSICYF